MNHDPADSIVDWLKGIELYSIYCHYNFNFLTENVMKQYSFTFWIYCKKILLIGNRDNKVDLKYEG